MANKVSITISSHNINGFKEDYVHSRCNSNLNSIHCIQEHWLRPAHKKIRGVNQLRVVHPAFDGYGVSAMKKVHTSGVYRGRGFGGTGFVFNKSFAPFLRPVLRYESERVSVMEVSDRGGSILIINVYCPFKQPGDEHRVNYLETLGFIENILSSNPSSRFIVLGDLNYNIYDVRQPMSMAINELFTKYDLFCTHELDDNFTRHSSCTHAAVGRITLIHYLIIFSSADHCEIVSRNVGFSMTAATPRTTSQ